MNNNQLSILLVEDDEVDIMNVKRAFKKNGVTNPLLVANDGVEALVLLNETEAAQRPRIILLDINMPRMNGIEFLQAIRAHPVHKSLMVFMLTTSDTDRDKLAAHDLNVAGYILKPVEFGDFIKAVSTLNLYWTLMELP